MYPPCPLKRVGVAIFLAACSQTLAGSEQEPFGARLPAAPAVGAPVDSRLNDAAARLLEKHPAVRVHIENDRPRVFYGAPMTPEGPRAVGKTPKEVAESWLMNHGSAFGAGQLELEELWITPVMNSRFTAVGYRQYIDGLPVVYGNVRLLVLNEPLPRVVFAAANVASRSNLADMGVELDAETAVALVKANPLFRALPEWSEPELAIFQGAGEWHSPTLVWKFNGQHPDPAVQQSKTFFVDAVAGKLVHVRNEIYYNEVTGSVKGWASPGVLPDAAYNPPTLQDVPEMRVRIEGGPQTLTTRQGLFSFPSAGTSQINVGAGVGVAQGFGGPWVNVVPVSASPVMQTLSLTPPGQADFVLNQNPTQPLTAQVNVFIGTTLVHNYFRDRAPNFNALDVALRANTGVEGTCNAFFRASDPSINFFNAGSNCPNTAYSSVIAHEYGHFIVNRLNLGQGGFGEGYSDTTAMLLYDDGVIGRGFTGFGSILRNPIAANVQYPCPSNQGIHHCGQILGGLWWRMREAFGTQVGSAAGLEYTRDLHVGWSLIADGGTGNNFRNSAHPVTAIEVLTIDDDDGNLSNGTPNWHLICDAFAAHGIDCPPLTLIEFELPQGAPAEIPPQQAVDIPVSVVPVAVEGQPGTGRIHYRLPGASSFQSEPMVETAPNEYLARLPGIPCGEFVDFYFTAQAVGGVTVTYPENAPAEPLAARAVGGIVEIVAFEDDFDTDKGWTVWNHPSLTEGHWERVIPRGTFYGGMAVQPGEAFRGQRCYLTENGAPGSSISSHDVDWGPTVLTSPRIDITGADVVDLSFAYWLFTLNGIPDELEVDVSPDDGVNWVRIATYGNSQGWRSVRFDLLEYIDPTPDLRIRFTISDYPNDSLTESAVDDVRVTLWQCQSECYANCDGSTSPPVLTVDDFTCFINRFAEAQNLPVEEQINHYANCDGSSTPPILTVSDFTCFINAFAQGCP